MTQRNTANREVWLQADVGNKRAGVCADILYYPLCPDPSTTLDQNREADYSATLLAL